MQSKACTKCKRIKKLEYFALDKTKVLGRSSACKQCRAEYKRRYTKENPDRVANSKQKYYDNNKEKILLKNKKYRQANKEKVNATSAARLRRKRRTDPVWKATCNMRRRLHRALNDGKKIGSHIKDLGCTLEELKQHLESNFQPSMSWENYGRRGWHIDHIKPLSSFDLSNREEFLQAVHYTNLQPLWAEENIKKGNKY